MKGKINLLKRQKTFNCFLYRSQKKSGYEKEKQLANFSSSQLVTF